MRRLFTSLFYKADLHKAVYSRVRCGRCVLVALLVGALACSSPSYAQAYERKWQVLLWPKGFTAVIGIGFGCRDYSVDGYDGYDMFWSEAHLETRTAGTVFYRTAEEGWDAQEGFYKDDIRFHIAPGASKTWDGIYAWVNGVEVPGNVTPYVVSPLLPDLEGLQARLVLDYVPPHLGYTGPTEFELDLHYTLVPLPVPNVTDPLLGTRMHITVTMVPEPRPCWPSQPGWPGWRGRGSGLLFALATKGVARDEMCFAI